MNDHKSGSIWFPAKRYGWGWGPPVAWQGWVVMVIFVAAMAAGGIYFRPDRHGVGFALWTMGDGLALTVVCYLKGEKPRWRWGDEVDSDEGKELK